MTNSPSKKTIWVNVSSISKWNRPPVGVIKTEAEFVKFSLISHKKFIFRYFVYEKELDKYSEISSAEVSKLYVFKKPEDSKANSHISEETYAQSITKILIKKLAIKIDEKLPSTVSKYYWKTIALVRQQYHNYWLVPKYHATIRVKNAIQIINRYRPSTSNSKNDHIDARFKSGDWIVSMGLDWDVLDLKSLYKIKTQVGFKVAFVCYDLIPVLYPHLCLMDVANGFSSYFVNVAWVSDIIFSISNNTQNDLKSFLDDVGSPIPQLNVIRLGDNAPHKTLQTVKIDDVHPLLSDNPFILFVSTIERRKNHESLYKAIRLLIDDEKKDAPLLVFVGMQGWGVSDLLSDIAKDPLVSGRILILNNLSDSELSTLYKHCQFTVFPSLYEGWGLPIAESLSYGKFCLASSTSAIPEVGRDLVDYIHPWDTFKWASEINKYSNNSKTLRSKENKIASDYKITDWSITCQAITKSIAAFTKHDNLFTN